MSERRLRMTIVAEIFGAIIMGLYLVADLLEPGNRIGVPVGILIVLLTIVTMIVVGVVGLWRPRSKK